MARESWTGRIGFVLAAAGSAVGLGNLWRFPWMTAENGGSAFLLVYLGIVLAVGVPGLLAEFVIGRRSQKSPVGALRDLSGSRNWGRVGLLSVLAGLVLLSFYSVVGGWILRYFLASPTGAYFENPGAYFGSISFGPEAAAFHVLFLLLTAGVVYGGVRDGIERATTVMMPIVFLALIGLSVWVSGLSGASAAYEFYLSFDVGAIQASFLDIVLAAAGQALFTLSVGAGTMITYASYVGEDRSLPADATLVAVLNTTVGVLAGLVVFPLLFSTPGADVETSGPGALFVGVATAFSELPAGRLAAAGFFAVVALAALSSSISMLEIVVAYLVDERDRSRQEAVLGVGGIVLVTGTASAFTPQLFEALAGPVVDFVLTAGLFAFVVFAAWVLGDAAVDEFGRGTQFSSGLADAWRLLVGVIIPPFLAFTLLVGVFELLGVTLPSWQLGLAGIAVAGTVVALVRWTRDAYGAAA
ncbi:sodium-dependent transporter [Haloarchaeobius iranensis]|uniref:Neurotransmitter:Na+ symporter, NSS family n=1 Tax=Haloarchaeobius iranensis TaxID=996166 RepID=A0A1G9XZV1_9EURY|nr:sodium-dependent transporter [Haloarchaeobius iranensis]SDN02290.1 neurotransmitter:Na+ symporter, NSS family [Haloarchaeobius iranensis]